MIGDAAGVVVTFDVLHRMGIEQLYLWYHRQHLSLPIVAVEFVQGEFDYYLLEP